MKRFGFTVVAAAFAAGASFADIDAGEVGALALKDAVAEAQASLAASSSVAAGGTVAILPLGGEGRTLPTGLLKNALTSAGLTCVEGKEDPVLDDILKEIAWDERKEDILDPATLDKFGRLKSAQYLLYGDYRRLAATERYVLVELELHMSSIATKEHVWGGSFVRRHYAPAAEPGGRVDIPVEVRNALVDGIRGKIAASLGKSTKLTKGMCVALLPTAGDIDHYADGLIRDVLAASAVTPVNLDVGTLAEARFALREGPGKADGIAYGVLRDLSTEQMDEGVSGERTYRASMELQLCIEKGATREILWSDTVQYASEFEVGPRGWWAKLCGAVPCLEGRPWLVVAVPVGVLLLLFVFCKFLRATTRVR